MRKPIALLAAAIALATPVAAKESLGVFGSWGAFRDATPERCYAIAMPRRSGEQAPPAPFASVATWPGRKIRSQVHIRLSREARENAAVTLQIGSRRFALTGNGTDAWAKDRTMDAAIVAAMRSAERMTARATATNGSRIADRYSLEGVATALDAATVACARSK